MRESWWLTKGSPGGYVSNSAVIFPLQAYNVEPTVNRGVIDIRTALSQHSQHLILAGPVFTVPVYGPHNYFTLKMRAF